MKNKYVNTDNFLGDMVSQEAERVPRGTRQCSKEIVMKERPLLTGVNKKIVLMNYIVNFRKEKMI